MHLIWSPAFYSVTGQVWPLTASHQLRPLAQVLGEQILVTIATPTATIRESPCGKARLQDSVTSVEINILWMKQDSAASAA